LEEECKPYKPLSGGHDINTRQNHPDTKAFQYNTDLHGLIRHKIYSTPLYLTVIFYWFTPTQFPEALGLRYGTDDQIDDRLVRIAGFQKSVGKGNADLLLPFDRG
jgi:hypothetical protein